MGRIGILCLVDRERAGAVVQWYSACLVCLGFSLDYCYLKGREEGRTEGRKEGRSENN